MATVDTATQTRFWDSFSTSTEDIRDWFYFGRATADDGHWTKWAYLYTRADLNLLCFAYKDPVPVLNAFARDYRTGNIAPNIRAVQSRTVEDAIRSIGQVIAVLGAKDPQMKTKGQIDGRLQLHFCCLSRQDPPPSRVKPIPEQVLCRLAYLAATSND